MLKEAINRILELAEPHTIEDTRTGKIYADKKFYAIREESPMAHPIVLHTLSSLVDYIRDFPESMKPLPYMLHVISPTEVEMISALDEERKRETIAVVKTEPPRIPFGHFIGNEDMLITVQSMFVDDLETDRAAVLKFAGTVTSGSVKDYDDDGVTQKATIRQGVASKTEAIVPSPCRLRPFRTFTEVEQPASTFIFRMKELSNGQIESALFEADGGIWKDRARENIYQYLKEKLKDTGIFIIS